MDIVSVIIPTFNRFTFLLNTIQSIKSQTYKNIEIIVVNDCSTQKEYYEYDWENQGVFILHLPQNSKTVLGYACAAYVRNKGIEISSGKYIGFCDDDDIWFSNKIECQLKAMKETGCKMSSTEGLYGNGVYNCSIIYPKYNSEHYYAVLREIYKSRGSNLMDNGFPYIWNLDFLRIHNCVICSSVLIEKEILDKINNMNLLNSGEDYDCWLRALEHTNNVYIDDVCFYYDGNHGYGQQYIYS
jgi:teichuronic acid biosynthesis glycosyltransferase TuaG